MAALTDGYGALQKKDQEGDTITHRRLNLLQ